MLRFLVEMLLNIHYILSEESPLLSKNADVVCDNAWIPSGNAIIFGEIVDFWKMLTLSFFVKCSGRSK